MKEKLKAKLKQWKQLADFYAAKGVAAIKANKQEAAIIGVAVVVFVTLCLL